MNPNFQFSILTKADFQFNFQLILLFAICCCLSCNNNVQNPVRVVTTTVATADSLLAKAAFQFVPTGNAKLDSLFQLAAVAPQDTGLARLYYQIAEMYENNDHERGKEYYLKSKDLSDRLDWTKGQIQFACAFSIMLAREGLMDSALMVIRWANEIAVKEKNADYLARLAVNTGNIFRGKQWYATALEHFWEAIPFFESRNDTTALVRLYQSMSQLYSGLYIFDKAIEFGEKAYALNNKDPFTVITLAKVYANLFENDKANNYFAEALEICKQKNHIILIGEIYWHLGNNALNVFDMQNAETYVKLAMEYAQKTGNTFLMPELILHSKTEQLKGNYAQSETSIREALQMAEMYDVLLAKKVCYMILSELAVAQRNYRESAQYWVEMDKIDKALATETAIQSGEEMAAKYETEKKELIITTLKEERRLMIWLGIAGGAILLLSLAASLILWRWTVQKRQLAETRIRQLEQEKQLIATQSVLDGETRERARLARDLHDGLGSLLTATKLRLLEMKQGVKLEYEDVERFDKALGLLDDSVHEMRRVAHHLMPDSLSRFGLKPAVGDFCSNLPAVQFSYYGNESRLDPNLEVMIYRSIHELVNNALKYAGANQIMVQIMQENDRIAFTVQDDGCGFDPSAVTKGMGLQNIRTRVASYNGVINIDSREREGTEINVELKV
jgi:signal transduction histidine kinase